MEEFLKISKSVRVVDGVKIHVVMGNESCDLDSTVSALTYAYYLHLSQDGHKSSAPTAPPLFPPGTQIIPLLNIARAEYTLRTDIQHVLNHNGLTAGLLTFRDELNLSSIHKAGKLSLTLVDFNVFPERDRALETAVVNVIDHRPKERKDNNKVSVMIEMVGSCSTIIANLFLSDHLTLPPEAVDLLYNAILTDTICLSKSAGKTTVKDEKVIAQLEQLRPANGQTRQEVFDEVNRIRQDVSGLSTSDVLIKDLKVIHSPPAGSTSVSVAMCSIMEQVTVFLKRSRVIEEVDEFTRSQSVTATILMCLHVNAAGEPTRQLAVFSQNLGVQQQLCQALLDSTNPSLSLSLLETAASPSTLRVYTQGNVVASRKAVLPLVVAALRTIAS